MIASYVWIPFTLWIFFTELLFFRVFSSSDEIFITKKIIAMFFGAMATLIFYGFPAMIAYVPDPSSGEVVGSIFFVWYYSALIVIAAFLGINYYFYKKMGLDKNESF